MKRRKNIVTFERSETGKANSEFTMLLLAEANCAKAFVSYWRSCMMKWELTSYAKMVTLHMRK